MKSFQRAIQLIELGVEHYQANDQALSAVRKFYAGTLLLAQEALVRAAPNTDPKDISNARPRTSPDGFRSVKFTTGDAKVDFSEIGRRFKALDLSIDQNALSDLHRTHLDIEYFPDDISPTSVREAIAKAFPVLLDLFRHMHEEPSIWFGDAWQTMLDVRSAYDREFAECRRTFEGVDWKSSLLARAAVGCAGCPSNLVARKDLTKSHHKYADAECRACGAYIRANKLIESVLVQHFDAEACFAVRGGEAAPLYDCPKCSAKAYVIWEEENACAWCQFSADPGLIKANANRRMGKEDQ